MKGIVFNLLSELIEKEFGLETLEKVINAANATDEGAYTAGETYPDEELFRLVTALSKETQVDPQILIKTFGQFMFPKLAAAYPVFIKDDMDLKTFLKTIDEVIHVEVNKLYPNASTPQISYEEPNEHHMILNYRSARKLCALSEGLIIGAAKHFNESITLSHPVCMHKGSDHCKIEIKFN